MSKLQMVLLPLLATAVFLFSGAVEPTAAPLLSIPGAVPARPLVAWAGEPRPLPAKLQAIKPVDILAWAETRFGPSQLTWLDMTFRQQAAYDDIHFEMEARDPSAPGQRFRYDLQVKIDAETSRSLTFCDGVKVVEMTQMPGKAKQISTAMLPKIEKPSDDPAAVAAARQTLLQGKMFAGVGNLLALLRAGLIEPKLQLVQIQGEEFLEIRGQWVVDQKTIERLPDELRLQATPRQCRVYLNPSSLWPRCVEWWGSSSASQPPVLLLQTVYNLTRLNQPLTAEELAREFAEAAK